MKDIKTIHLNTESGTVLLNSNQKLIIEKDVTLSAVVNNEKYYEDKSVMFSDNCGNELGRALIFANGCKNIEVCGIENSIIDGKGYLWGRGDSKRPSIIRLVNCENVVIKNLKLINSACWCIHLQNCNGVLVENVQIISDSNANNDGIDIDCCSNVTVKNCYIENGDDAIVLKSTKNICCENINVENCTINTKGAGFKIGTESVGDFKNITYKNNRIISAEGCAIKIVPVDGATVKDVLIENVVAERTTGPIFIVNGFRQRVYFSGHEKNSLSKIQDITIKNVKANVFVRNDGYADDGRGVVFISGTAENKIENVFIKDCEFLMPGGEQNKEKQYFVKEQKTEYPEYYLLGDAPAYGSFIRHANKIKFENVVFNTQELDVREKIYLSDVDSFENI